MADSIVSGDKLCTEPRDLIEPMKENGAIQEFSLLGGPLHKMGCRLGLIREGSSTLGLGIALGLFCWAILMALAGLEGLGWRVFSMATIGAHVRLLIAIPCLFLGESCAAPQMAEFTRYVVRSGVVPENSVPRLESNIRRAGQIKDSRLAEALLFVVAFALPLAAPIDAMVSTSGSWAALRHASGGKFPLTTGWYMWFCLPFFRFLLFRWLWRLGLWWWFLWRLQRLELRLIPTHSDRSAGLGFLVVVHENFAPVILAISAVWAAQFAEGIHSGTTKFDALYGWVPIVLLLNATVFMAPVCMFVRKLWNCRIKGMSEYMGMADRYVAAFDRRWIRDPGITGDSQLGAADLQSLADLTNSVDIVRGMRWIPVGQRQITVFLLATIVPLLPLLLLKYPIDQLLVKAFQMLIGV